MTCLLARLKLAVLRLTGDHLVTYRERVSDDTLAPVFKALADATRRELLDRLHAQDGQTLSELVDGFEMTRFGVMKHLRILEGAGLVTTVKVGREKRHYLNPVPIRQIYDRWVHKYAEPHAAALLSLKNHLESDDHD